MALLPSMVVMLFTLTITPLANYLIDITAVINMAAVEIY